MPRLPWMPETEDALLAVKQFLVSGGTVPTCLASKRKGRVASIERLYYVKDDKLWYGVKNSRLREVLCIFEYPRKREEVQRSHLATNHADWNKTFTALRENFVGIREVDVKQAFSEMQCLSCLANNSIKEVEDYQPIFCSEPWGHVQVDAIDLKKYDKQNRGYKWVLVFIDVLTRFVVAVPLKSRCMASTIAALKKVFSVYGVPLILHSDNGGEFKNVLWNNFCQKLGIEFRHGRSRKPSTQGLVERMNQTIIRRISKSLYPFGTEALNWIDHLGKAVHGINHTQATAHRKVPFCCMFNKRSLPMFYSHLEETGNWKSEGPNYDFFHVKETDRESDIQNLPFKFLEVSELPELVNQDETDELDMPVNVRDALYANLSSVVMESVNNTRSTAVALRTRQQKDKQKRSVHMRGKSFKVGDKVLVKRNYDSNKATKKQKLGDAPFGDQAVVTHVKANNTYLVDMGNGLKRTIPRKDLKTFPS